MYVIKHGPSVPKFTYGFTQLKRHILTWLNGIYNYTSVIINWM